MAGLAGVSADLTIDEIIGVDLALQLHHFDLVFVRDVGVGALLMIGPHDLNRDVVPSLSLLSGVNVSIVGSESEIWRGSLRLRELLHHIELLHATLFVELVEQLPLAESFLE